MKYTQQQMKCIIFIIYWTYETELKSYPKLKEYVWLDQ